MDPDEELEAAFVPDDLDAAFEQGTAEVPSGYAETGARVLELPETTVIGDPSGGGSVSVAGTAPVEYREVSKQWTTDESAQAPDGRSLAERLRHYVSGADPEALDDVARLAPQLRAFAGDGTPSIGGRDLPTLASLRRAASVGGDLDVAMPATNTDAPILGRDYRPESGITGATDAATFGWADELAGLVRGDQAVEQERARTEGAQEQAPGTYNVGVVGGSAPLMAIPGGQATAVGRIGAAGATGAGAGFLRGAGESEGSIGERLRAGGEGAALEGAIGAGTVGLAEGASAVGPRVVEAIRGTRPVGWIDDLAASANNARAQARLQAAGIRNPSPAATTRAGRHMARLGGPEAIADMLDAERVGGRLLPSQNIADDLDRLRRGAGAQFDDVLQQMDAAGGGVSRSELANRGRRGLMAELADIDTESAGRASRRIGAEYIEPLERRAAPGPLGRAEDQMGWSDAHRLRQQYDQDARTWTRSSDPVDTSSAAGAQDMRDHVSGLMDEGLDAVDPALRPQWQDANRRWSLLNYLTDNATPAPSRLASALGEGLSLGDPTPGNFASAVGSRMMGSVTSRLGPGLRARAWGGIRNVLRTAGSPGMRRAARMMEAAERRGGSAPAAVHALLMRSDPEYRAAVEAAESGGEPQEMSQ